MIGGNVPMAEIELAAGTEENGLAQLIAELLRQNLEQHPPKRKWLNRLRGKVSIEANDAGVGLTMAFEGGRCLVSDGLDARAKLKIKAASEDIMKLSAVKLRGGLPDLFDHGARSLAVDILKGRISIKGILRHPLLLLGLTNLFSVA